MIYNKTSKIFYQTLYEEDPWPNYYMSYIFNFFISVPPSSINITGYYMDSRVEIKEHDELELTCKVSGAKPKPQIIWFKKGIPFIPGN